MEVKSDFKRWAETYIGLNNDHFDENITNVILLISASDIVLRKLTKIFTFYFAVRVSIVVVGALSSNDATATRTSKKKKTNNRFNKQNNDLARASDFFEHFFAVFALLRRESA